jgi:hypothetical protein
MQGRTLKGPVLHVKEILPATEKRASYIAPAGSFMVLSVIFINEGIIRDRSGRSPSIPKPFHAVIHSTRDGSFVQRLSRIGLEFSQIILALQLVILKVQRRFLIMMIPYISGTTAEANQRKNDD